MGHSFFRNLARAQISGHPVGMLKILFHRETLEILGIHCFGSQAAEIIHIGQAVMMQKNGGNDLRFFINTTFNYPTMAEAYRGRNRGTVLACLRCVVREFGLVEDSQRKHR